MSAVMHMKHTCEWRQHALHSIDCRPQSTAAAAGGKAHRDSGFAEQRIRLRYQKADTWVWGANKKSTQDHGELAVEQLIHLRACHAYSRVSPLGNTLQAKAFAQVANALVSCRCCEIRRGHGTSMSLL